MNVVPIQPQAANNLNCEEDVDSDPVRGLLRTAQEAISFMTAGNSTVTFVSRKTGTHFTYRIWRPENASEDMHFVSLLTGPDNESSYRYMGRLRRGVYFHGRTHTKAGDIQPSAPSAVAFMWGYGFLVKGIMPLLLEVMHEGKCGRCGRKLTHPNSIATGIGPECARHVTGGLYAD